MEKTLRSAMVPQWSVLQSITYNIKLMIKTVRHAV